MDSQDRYETVRKWWRRTLITVTALSAAAASFIFLRDLALHAGWPPWAAWLLPLFIDALAAAALTEYHRTRSKAVLLVAVLTIVGSATGNAYSHLYTVGLLEPGWVAVTSVGAVPAVAVGLVVHLFTARRPAWNHSDSPTSTGTRTSVGSSGSASSSATGATKPEPVTAAAAVPNRRNGTRSNRGRKPASSPRRTDTELASRIYADGMQDASLDRIASHYGVSKSRATELRKQARGLSSPAHLNGQPSNPELVGAP